MNRAAAIALPAALCLTLAGCGSFLLERSYASTVAHSAAYWENVDADTLRAESYQELINALLILLAEHSEDGVVRYYGSEPNPSELADRACVEVRREIPLGAYLLDYITYAGATENGCYELTVHFGYHRSAEEQAAIVNATSTEALPDLLRDAIAEGRKTVAVRVGYFGGGRAGVTRMVADVRDEFYAEYGSGDEEAGQAGEAESNVEQETLDEEALAAPPEADEGSGEEEIDVSPWQILFYPDSEEPGIVEVILSTE